MKLVLLDTATLGEDIDLSPISTVEGFDRIVEYKSTSPEEVVERLTDADAVILNKIKLGEQNLSRLPRLRLICVTATGYDNIDVDYCRSHGIALYNVPAYSTESVAQLTLAMALSLACRLNDYRDFVHSGAYSESGIANRLTPIYHELSGTVWGVIGGGGIGSRVASLATAMGCRVLMCRRTPDSRYEQADVDTLCRTADIISLHVPLSEETRGMIGTEQLASMKNGAILINVARGAVTDEEAVARAIESGHLGGFASDVYSREPFDKSHPFYRILGYRNVCLTPHMAWGSAEARARCIAVIVENLRSYLDGNEKNRIV
ncbi:MAG: hydroxyacid dehydrogenase [Clostridia bacterium]|nr:hydroxyacid dehydrogenase [Clostridia bacterium]